MKLSKRQASIAYWGGVVQEWRASGKWSEASILHMVIGACEYSEVLGQRDVVLIFDVANGVRCA